MAAGLFLQRRKETKTMNSLLELGAAKAATAEILKN